MKNVTISMDEETAAWARVEAAKAGKSLSRYVGDLLAEGRERSSKRKAAIDAFLAGPLWPLSDENGRMPTRDEIYAERLHRLEHSSVREGPAQSGEAEGRHDLDKGAA
jgi:hypothetical protein